MNNGSENIGTGESGGASRQHRVVDLVAWHTTKCSFEQQRTAVQIRRRDRQGAREKRRLGNSLGQTGNRRNPEHASEPRSLRDSIEKPPHDGGHLIAEHGIVADHGIESVEKDHCRTPRCFDCFLQQLEQTLWLEDEF